MLEYADCEYLRHYNDPFTTEFVYEAAAPKRNNLLYVIKFL